MKRFFKSFGGHLLNVLIASFVLVAGLATGLNAIVTSRVINEYLLNAQTDRLARDLDLANGFYQQKLNDVASVSRFVALDTQTQRYFSTSMNGDMEAKNAIDQVITRMLSTNILDGTRVVLVLGPTGNIITGRAITADGELSLAFSSGNWAELPIITKALSTKEPIASTEIISHEFLSQVGLDKQATIAIATTLKANEVPYDMREGTAGLAMVSTYPLTSASGLSSGLVVTVYLFNNDFTLVDYIKNEAKVETMTIFLGDLRVSTNVPDENGGRAVGTRSAQDVYQKVLVQGENYSGRVFVVNNWYIGSYEPLRDFQGNVVGMMYVGVRETIFQSLVYAFNTRAAWIALVCILIAAAFAIPIARLITHPIASLAAANRRLAKGDMNVRVEESGTGEIALLCTSFNNMVETLQETEKELLQQAKLASVGQLAAGVAHELNNPLGTILLYSDIMLKESAAEDPRREDLKMIISEVKRCKTIVADLLNFAREHEISARDVDVHALVDEVINKDSAQPTFEKIEFVKQYDSNLPLIQADAAQLQQVFVNLFSNAAYAMDNAGKIIISTHIVDGQSVEIRVADTGCGIPAENLSKLFTPFFTTKPAGKGTGLGLSIVYGIIKLHRGQIMVQSKVGQGTTIIITLPVHLPNGSLNQSASVSDLIM